MNQYTGKITIKANGRTLNSKPGATLDPGFDERPEVVTDHGVGFYKTPRPSRIEATLAFGRGDRLGDFDFEGATCVFECDTGQQFVINNAFTREPPVLSGNGGDVRAVIMGDRAQEATS